MNADAIDPRELAKQELFAGIDEATISRFIECMERVAYQANDTIIHENETGNRLYLIESGRCEVLKRVLVKDGIANQRIAVLRPGNTFGEMELIDRQPRSATVRAMDAVTVLTLSAVDLYEKASSDYKTFSLILLNIAREISLRLRDTDMWLAGSLFSVKKYEPKAFEQDG